MGQKRKLTFISRSDLRGGAAIVTYRLVEALRAQGTDARMLVCEKLSDSDFVERCAPGLMINYAFLKERLEVFLHNGLDRKNLFKVDPASEGLPLHRHPWVKDADAIFLGWINQGMLSLDGIKRLAETGKPLVWIMHDMWNMTGICHHAGDCEGYLNNCGNCPLLGSRSGDGDMSRKIWERKKRLYDGCGIRFVAVSTWLAGKAGESSLMRDLDVSVIPNPFSLSAEETECRTAHSDGRVRIAFGAARLDDPIKGLPVLKKALEILKERHPEEASRMQLVTFGNVKNPGSLEGFHIGHIHLGVLKGQDAIRDAYRDCDIVVSTSEFETLPGTLVEGQAYGCVPVAIDHGGQSDIIEHMSTGWLAPWDDNLQKRAEHVAEGLLWAYRHHDDEGLKERMRISVKKKFDAPEVAHRILEFVF